ncbi:MAG: DUF4388 domain-containing protein, partial [Planctomycetota bacterium]
SSLPKSEGAPDLHQTDILRTEIRTYIVCSPYPPIRLKKESPNRIGRDPNGDLVLPHKTVSRTHATVEWNGRAFLVKDLGSQNGTFVNDLRVQETEIRPGDRIRLGVFLATLVEADARSIFHPIREAEAIRTEDTEPLAAPEKAGSSLSGTLQQMSLPSLLQSLDAERRTGVLHLAIGVRLDRTAKTMILKPKASEGTLALADGRIVDARICDLSGENALFMLLSSAQGNFRFDGHEQPPARTLNMSVQEALLEYLRRLDERTRSGIPESSGGTLH